MKRFVPGKLFVLKAFLIVMIGTVGCNWQTEEKKEIYYIIKEEFSKDPNEPPPPPPPLYGRINIILVGKSTIYVHRKYPHPADDNYIERPDQLPLTRTDLHEFDVDELPKFLASSYQQADSKPLRRYFTCIKSPSDTIYSQAYPVIKKFFQERNFKGFIVRKWTHKERQLITSSH